MLPEIEQILAQLPEITAVMESPEVAKACGAFSRIIAQLYGGTFHKLIDDYGMERHEALAFVIQAGANGKLGKK